MIEDDDATRRCEAFIRRNRAARRQLLEAAARPDETVGDGGPAASFGKGLEHDADGVPAAEAYLTSSQR